MFFKEAQLRRADTKSEKWKRLCPPDDNGLGPMGIKASEDAPEVVICLLLDPASYELVKESIYERVRA